MLDPRAKTLCVLPIKSLARSSNLVSTFPAMGDSSQDIRSQDDRRLLAAIDERTNHTVTGGIVVASAVLINVLDPLASLQEKGIESDQKRLPISSCLTSGPHSWHSAPIETHAFGFTLRANAPEGKKRFPISQ
jgi:hypothetical protein